MKTSVIIPTYNRRGMVGRAIDSVLRQTGVGTVEVIVVDDGSTDGTVQFIQETYKEVRIFEQPHRGAPAARNCGIRHAKGEFIALLDSDDELTPKSLAIRATLLDQNPDVGWVCCNYDNCIDGEEGFDNYFERIDLRKILRFEKGRGDLLMPIDFFGAHLRCSISSTISIMIRREMLRDALLFQEDLAIGQDWEFCLRLSHFCRVGIAFDVVALRHVHKGNLSSNKNLVFSGQVALNKVVMAYPWLTEEQKSFLKDRTANDLYELAYFELWVNKDRKAAVSALIKSMMGQMTIPKLKLIIACCMPKVLSANRDACKAK